VHLRDKLGEYGEGSRTGREALGQNSHTPCKPVMQSCRVLLITRAKFISFVVSTVLDMCAEFDIIKPDSLLRMEGDQTEALSGHEC
jgi:hypothetical protein